MEQATVVKNVSNLSKKMKELGLNQGDMAAMVGVTQGAISLACKEGLKSMNVAKKYAEALGCEWKDILD